MGFIFLINRTGLRIFTDLYRVHRYINNTNGEEGNKSGYPQPHPRKQGQSRNSLCHSDCKGVGKSAGIAAGRRHPYNTHGRHRVKSHGKADGDH